MRERADGNVVDTRRRNLAYILERDSAARLKLHFPSPERDGFAHLGRLHVVEEDYVDAFDFEKRAHLFEAIGFDFDPNSRAFLVQALDRAGEFGETGADAQVIVLYQDHIIQGKAMVGAATCHDRRFFQRTQAGRCFPCIKNLRV